MKYRLTTLLLAAATCVACGDDGTTEPGMNVGGSNVGGNPAGGSGNMDDPMNSAGSPDGGGGAPPTGGADGMPMGGSDVGGSDTGGTDTGGADSGGADSGGAGGEAMGGGDMGGAGGEAGGGAGGMENMSPSASATLAPTGLGTGWESFSATATFVEEGGMVTLTVTAMGCPDGEWPWHLHTEGACGNEGNDAGGHWAVQGKNVGEQGSALSCSGGTGELTLSVAAEGDIQWTVEAGDYSVVGHAIVVHEGTVASPADRVACGVIAM